MPVIAITSPAREISLWLIPVSVPIPPNRGDFQLYAVKIALEKSDDLGKQSSGRVPRRCDDW